MDKKDRSSSEWFSEIPMSGFLLADDLSGALDAGAAFHLAGYRISTVLQPAEAAQAGQDADVVAMTTETRNTSPSNAAARVTAALAIGKADGRRLLFKKIDSTMRGPVAAELKALATAMPGTKFLFSPANPAAGRTVRDGCLRVHGVPVNDTEFGRDPVSPVRTSDLRELMGSAGKGRIVIADAEVQADLETAVARMDADGEAWVGVGSGALARAIATRHSRPRSPLAQSWPADLPPTVLMICGSAHGINRVQAETLRRERNVAVQELPVADRPVDFKAVPISNDAQGGILIVQSPRVDSEMVLRAVTTEAVRLITELGVRRLFITGGETAFAICRALGVSSLNFLTEIEPGVSVSSGAFSEGRMLLAVKPGGFGDAATWVRVWDRLSAP